MPTAQLRHLVIYLLIIIPIFLFTRIKQEFFNLSCLSKVLILLFIFIMIFPFTIDVDKVLGQHLKSRRLFHNIIVLPTIFFISGLLLYLIFKLSILLILLAFSPWIIHISIDIIESLTYYGYRNDKLKPYLKIIHEVIAGRYHRNIKDSVEELFDKKDFNLFKDKNKLKLILLGLLIGGRDEPKYDNEFREKYWFC